MSNTDTTDPITTEIIRSAFVAITDEMKTNLMRSAHNPVIYEALDYTVGLFDATGDTLSIGLGLPSFIGGLADSIRAKLAFYGEDGIDPGDILLTNDPYIMGSHLNHLVFTQPIFDAQGVLVAFASTMAHWQDIGGTLAGTTTDIYSEGLQLPICKIFKKGKQDPEITNIIKANVRLPDSAMGDFFAQVAAVKTGERRFFALLQKYGTEQIRSAMRQIMDQSEAQARRVVASFPDGVYEAESFMDDDGVTLGKPIPLRVKVIIEGDQMTVDLSNISPQVAGYYNAGASAGRSCAQVAFKCLTSPKLLPINEGSFRALKIVLPPGRVVSAEKPAAVRWWMTIPMTIVDTIFRALASKIPDHVIAGHHADIVVPYMYGTDPRSGRFFIDPMLGVPGGGWGATSRHDGMSATICVNDGDTHNTPIEAGEVRIPYITEYYRLRLDSGGPGRYRGGLGAEVCRRVLAHGFFNSQIERTIYPPWGVEGGHAALPNKIRVRRANGDVEEFPNGKVNSLPVTPGDAIIISAGGGGGFGDPLERDPEAVRWDVIRLYVSPEQARDVYGVVLDGNTKQVDAEGAKRRRAELRHTNGAQADQN
jgi:N-methylhydantoinase B